MVLQNKSVDIRGLKKWARDLGIKSNLRELILLEDDRIPVEEYLGKMMVWDSLSCIEEKDAKTRLRMLDKSCRLVVAGG